MTDDLVQIGWVLHIDADGGNDAFWWIDKYPEEPAAGCVPAYVILEPEAGSDV